MVKSSTILLNIIFMLILDLRWLFAGGSEQFDVYVRIAICVIQYGSMAVHIFLFSCAENIVAIVSNANSISNLITMYQLDLMTPDVWRMLFFIMIDLFPFICY